MTYTIRITGDYDMPHPWDESDVLPPMAVLKSDFLGRRRDFISFGVIDGTPCIPEAQVRKHWRAILSRLGYAPDASGLKQLARDEGDGDSLWETLVSAVEYYISAQGADMFADLEWVYREIVEWPAYHASIDGSTDLLMVATPEFLERIGQDTFTEQQFRGAATLYEQYATGDVWSIEITDSDGQVVDSICGVYGHEYAEEMADEMLRALDNN